MGDEMQTICPGPHLEQAETALFERFISRLHEGRYDECHKIVGLLEALSLV